MLGLHGGILLGQAAEGGGDPGGGSGTDVLLLSGDMQSGTDALLLSSSDELDPPAKLLLSGDMQDG